MTRLLLGVLLVLATGAWARPHRPVAMSRVYLEGRTVQVVSVNLSSPRVQIQPLLARSGRGRPFGELLGSKRPQAAMTGTFFDTATGAVVGSIVSQGRLVEEGFTGSALAIDRHHKARLLDTSHRMGRYIDWTPYDFAISGGPTLVRDGHPVVMPQSEGFRDRGLLGAHRRTALGVTRDGHLLLVAVNQPTDLHTLADIMRELGARQALNMDGGTSSGLYYRGQMLVSPKRKLTNLIAVYESGAPAPLAQSRSDRALEHYQRGLEELQMRRLVLARSQLSMAVANCPWQPRYHSALAQAEQKTGHRQAAVDQYLKAARLYLDHGKPGQALTVSRRAVELAPQRPDAQLMLGEVASQAGQRGQAKQALETVVARYPGHPQATRLLASLSKG